MIRQRLPRSHVLAGLAAAAVFAPSGARAQTSTPIRVVGLATDDTTPVQYAITNGWYAKAGLDVSFVGAASSALATQAVIGGSQEIGLSSPVAFLRSRLAGSPITLIGHANVWNPKRPAALMIVEVDAPAATGADLTGMILGTAALHDINQLAMNAWIDKTGGDSTTVKWIEVPDAAAGDAVADHRIAATMLQEPQLTVALRAGHVRPLAPAYSAFGLRMTSGVYVAHPDWAAKNAAAVATFTQVTYASAAYCNLHHGETAALMAEIMKTPLDVIKKMVRTTSAVSTDPSCLQSVIDVAAKYKLIPSAFDAKDAYFTG